MLQKFNSFWNFLFIMQVCTTSLIGVPVITVVSPNFGPASGGTVSNN